MKAAVKMEPNIVRDADMTADVVSDYKGSQETIDLQNATPRSSSETTYWTMIAAITSPHPIVQPARKENAMAMDLRSTVMLAIAPRKAVIQMDDTSIWYLMWPIHDMSGPSTTMPPHRPNAAVVESQADSCHELTVEPKM